MRQHLADLLPRKHLGDPHHVVTLGPQRVDGRLRLGGQLRGVGGAGQQDDLRRRSKRRAARSRWGTPFWRVIRPTKTTDGRRGSTPRRSTTSVPGSGRYSSVSMPLCTTCTCIRVERRVAGEDVPPRRRADGDHGVGGLVGGLLGPRREPIAPAELLQLPRPVRFERVRRDDVRGPVEQLGEMPGQVGVPGVGVGEIGTGAAAAIARSAEKMRSAGLAISRRGSSSEKAVASGPSGARGRALDIDQLAQLADEEVDVHAGTAVDLRRVLPRHHGHPHARRP